MQHRRYLHARRVVATERIRDLEKYPWSYTDSGYAHRYLPPRQVLCRADRALLEDDGHTQRVRLEGPSGRLEHRILHDGSEAVAQVALEPGSVCGARGGEADDDALDRTFRFGSDLADLGTRSGRGDALLTVCDGTDPERRPGWYDTPERTMAEAVLAITLLSKRAGANK